MGKVIDTTDFIDTSMSHKSKTGKNFQVENNYWLDSLQNKIDASWYMASDKADIYEEIQEYDNRGYIKVDADYKKIEVRLNRVYDDKGKLLSEDFKKVIFKDIRYKCKLGKKFKFDQENFETTDDSDRDVWLTINKNEAMHTQEVQIRRCNCNLGFLVENNSIEWYEPAIIDYDPRYTITHLNPQINVPNAQAYIITQFNEYTKNIKMNHRFIIGAIDTDNLDNNTVYKVKAVFRIGQALPKNPNSIPFVMLALEQDQVNKEIDYIKIDESNNYHYIADYYTKKTQENDNSEDITELNGFCLKLDPPKNIINPGDSVIYTCKLCTKSGDEIESEINFKLNLEGAIEQDNYYTYNILNSNQIEITGIKKYLRSDLTLTCQLCSGDHEEDIPDLIYRISLLDE